MAIQLYLLRHSYAEDSANQSDRSRALTHDGVAKVRTLGRHLVKQDFDVDMIYCSPALRTTETAQHLTEELGFSESLVKYDESIYGASVRELLQVVNATDLSFTKVMIIGHNPAISFLGDYLTKADIEFVAPCGLVHMSFDGLAWNEVTQGAGELIARYHPDDELQS